MESSQLIHPRTLIRREDGITLESLVREGLEVIGRGGAVGKLKFVACRAPFAAREGSGWQVVEVRSPFGEESTLLYEPWEGGRVSGVVRLVRPVRKEERKVRP